jgi:hypothetical protein
MRTDKQIQASRANGRRSQGPITPEGKARSAQNAYRHGLLAKTVTLSNEAEEDFLEYLDQHVDRFQPADDVEMNLIEEAVGAAWRERRSAGLQTFMLDLEMAAIPISADFRVDMVEAFNRLATKPGLALLQRYETRFHLIYHRAIATLMKLQKSRRPDPDPPIPNEPKPDPIVALPNEPKPAEEARSAANPPTPNPHPQPPFSQPPFLTRPSTLRYPDTFTVEERRP